MKLNWGKSIVIAFALFIGFILYFVFKVQSNSKYDNELVVEEYYKHDAKYGDEMVLLQNTVSLVEKPSIKILPAAIEIVFPEQFNPQKVSGKVSFYRPSAKKLDFSSLLKLSGQSMLIPKKDLAGGRWDISLSWNYEGKSYLMKQQIYFD